MNHSSASPKVRESAAPADSAAAPMPPTLTERDIEAATVLDSLVMRVALLNAHGMITSVNRAWRQFGRDSGATAEQANPVGLNYLNICASSASNPQDAFAAAAHDGIAAVLAGTQPQFELEYPCHAPDAERWFLMRASPLVGPHGGAVVTHEDITERWMLEHQRTRLLSELLDLKAALDAHAIVAVTDAQGRIIDANDKFCAVSKWSRDELIGQDHRLISSGHHSKEFIQNLWATIQSGAVWTGELKNRAKDGSIYWVDTTIVPFLNAAGKPTQYIAIRAEITESKLLEAHNEATLKELQAANQELNDFAYVVSHDLKAPLRGIGSLASWLVTDHADTLNADGKEQLNLIGSRVKRLSSMIDAILAYSRAGRSRDDRAALELDPLVRNTIDLLAPPPHIQVVVARPLPQLTIEAVKIQQVFQNLLSNAIDFIDKPEGRIVVDCDEDDAHWHFSVSDNGQGIEERHFQRVFQLFQTLATRDERERTGVGLALVKKIVELEGGRIWVESTLGVGTRFHFTIPRQASSSAAAGVPDRRSSAPGPTST